MAPRGFNSSCLGTPSRPRSKSESGRRYMDPIRPEHPEPGSRPVALSICITGPWRYICCPMLQHGNSAQAYGCPVGAILSRCKLAARPGKP
ncbi:hypothetical protein GQ53DRAFT_740859 [Thozetella sp. PMI_491]|nr:hypothetical protein GQ53DRAFT_740859 [Thozetella sp. PMI_491]